MEAQKRQPEPRKVIILSLNGAFLENTNFVSKDYLSLQVRSVAELLEFYEKILEDLERK